jgi:16S rRNA (guanine(1405)-N(7))-methyltransferase
MPVEQDVLEQVIAEVCKNNSYARIDSTLLQKIAAQELGKRKSIKEAVKETRSKLHQIGTVYLNSSSIPLPELSAITPEQRRDQEFQKAWCLPYLSQHASTRERLPFLNEYYQTIFQQLPPVKQVLDLACGLNPLCRPWMPLAPEAAYTAWDIFSDVIALINTFFLGFGYKGQAELHDLTSTLPTQAWQVVFLLKTLPCLEQIQKGYGEILLRQLNAEVLVISFPSKSLGGKNKGMAAHYDAYLQAILDESKYTYSSLSFPNESVYILKKRAPHA